MPAAKPKPKAQKDVIVVPAPSFQVTSVRIAGTSSLIVNCFPEKELMRMREKHAREEAPSEKTNRPGRDYNQEYHDSLYHVPGGGYGFPAIAFKHALVGACRQVSGLDMTLAKRLIFVEWDAVSRGFNVVRLAGKPNMREDLVRLSGANKPPDVRYRAEFLEWGCTLRIQHNAAMISSASLLNLLVLAGISEGVGENRPSSPVKTGDHGCFEIDQRKVQKGAK